MFIDDYLEVEANSSENEWRLDIFGSTSSLFLGAGDDKETSQYFKGCMKNFAIQFKFDNLGLVTDTYVIMYITEPLAF